MTYTTTNSVGQPAKSMNEIMRALERFAKGPRCIGNFMGSLVYVDETLPPGEIVFRYTDGRALRVSIDHPYIQGTALEQRARAALSLGESAPPVPKEV